MNSCRPLFVVLLLLMFTAGCGSGSGSGFDPNQVTLAVSPATAIIHTSDTVALQGTLKGSSNDAGGPLTWSIAELQTNGGSGSQCDYLDTPPPGPCPDGTIQQILGTSMRVTYHPPSSPGTFHVVADWSFGSGSAPVIHKDATSVITVTP